MKWNRTTRGRIAGISGIALGGFMLIQFNDLKGLIPMFLGSLLLFWMYKNGK